MAGAGTIPVMVVFVQLSRMMMVTRTWKIQPCQRNIASKTCALSAFLDNAIGILAMRELVHVLVPGVCQCMAPIVMWQVQAKRWRVLDSDQIPSRLKNHGGESNRIKLITTGTLVLVTRPRACRSKSRWTGGRFSRNIAYAACTRNRVNSG